MKKEIVARRSYVYGTPEYFDRIRRLTNRAITIVRKTFEPEKFQEFWEFHDAALAKAKSKELRTAVGYVIGATRMHFENEGIYYIDLPSEEEVQSTLNGV